MNKEEVMEIIIKEFPFIKFQMGEDTKDPILSPWYYKDNNARINITHSENQTSILAYIVTFENNLPKNVFYITKDDNLLEQLYKYLPKKFYLPYFRYNRINDLLS